MRSLAPLLAASFCVGLTWADGEELGPHQVVLAPRHSGANPVAFTSSNVQLVGWVPLGGFPAGNSSGNDCWGYTSPSGREYALMAMSNGTGFVEVTDPGAPVVIDFEAGAASFNRGVKTYSHYAYAVSEGGGGIQVFDLTAIDSGVVTLVNTVTTGGTTTATHTLAVDEVSGFLYRAGGSGHGIRIYDLASPANPTFVAQTTFGYVHECQPVTWDVAGPYFGKQIVFCYVTGSGVRILDVTNKAAITTVAFFPYPGVSYSHQGWTSASKRHFYLNDESDDWSFGASCTRVFDITNLAAPVYQGFFSSGAGSIDHNLYVNGNRIYEANYTSGLRIFDNTNPSAPTQVGFFDTDPSGDALGFSSLWTNYPFFASGTILGGDIERGLFIWREGAPGLEFGFPAGEPALVAPSGGEIQFSATEVVPATLVPGSVKLYYAAGGPFHELPATPMGGEVYQALLPDTTCGTAIQYYLAGKTNDGVTWTSPPAGGTQAHHTVAADSVSIASADDMEVDLGWSVNLAADLSGFATATTGTWTRVDPLGTSEQPEDDQTPDPGHICWVTGQGTGGSVGEADVDGGATALRSPLLDASSLSDPFLSYWRWYSNSSGSAPGLDTMSVHLSNDGGSTWVLAETVGPTGPATSGGWIKASLRIVDFLTPTSTMCIRFLVSDLGEGSIVEAAVDDLVLNDYSCPALDVDVISISPAEGSFEDWVTIEGSGFRATTTVSFGSRPAHEVRFIDQWTLEARVPRPSGPASGKNAAMRVDVTVSNPGTDTLANGYRYVPRNP